MDRTSSDDPVLTRLELAVEIARAAGVVTLDYFRRNDLQVERKQDKSPVTVADRAAEQELRRQIAEKFDGDGIIGEEFGSILGSTGYQWVLDPIDGTKSFIHGVPLYTVLIAVLHENQPILGVIHAPALAETVYAAKGHGCWYLCGEGAEARATSVSEVASLEDGLLVTTDAGSFTHYRQPDAFDVYLRLQQQAGLVRTWGDGYGYLLVATGRAEAMIDPAVSVWDAAPLQTIIEEAGGKFSDWKGEATIHSGDALASNARVHDEVLAAIGGN